MKRLDKPESGARTIATTTASDDYEFPNEAFACPRCGQMLAPDVRVCVACRKPIDLAQIRKPVPIMPLDLGPPRATPVRFSWGIFLFVLGLWCLGAIAAQRFLGPAKSQWAMGGVVVLTSGWVFYDAQGLGLPRPLRWGVGSLLLWIVIFPWYLARRRTPQAPCPLMEGQLRPFTLVVVLILMVFFLIGAVMYVLNGPPR